jgi:hypothetical protein
LLDQICVALNDLLRAQIVAFDIRVHN